MTSVQNNDQRLLDRILDDQHRRLAPEKGRDDFFTFFAADKALQDWDLDNDEIMDGVVDGAHDCGIDGIWTFVDDRYVTADAHQYLPSRANTIELVILQAKTSPGYQETVIEKLHFHLPTLLDMSRDEEELVAHTNAKLLDRTRRFLHILEELASSFPQVRVKVIYASKAAESPHPNVKSKGDRLRRELAKITSDTKADLEYLNAADLRERTARGAKAVAQLVFSETPTSTSLGEGYVCLARLDEYYRFITSDNEALRLELFESNVRDYAGSTAVNNAIGETLKSGTGEDFWWFNNGVTVVADAAQIAGKKIVVKDPQIVNGLQTSHEVYSYFQAGGQHRDRSVLVKIVVAPESGTARDRIIRPPIARPSCRPAPCGRPSPSRRTSRKASPTPAATTTSGAPATTATSASPSTGSSAWPAWHGSSPPSSCASHTPRCGTQRHSCSTTSTTARSSPPATTWTSTVSASTSTPGCVPS